jgi:hypothetical protein
MSLGDLLWTIQKSEDAESIRVGRDCEELVVPWVLTVRKQPQETRRQGY